MLIYIDIFVESFFCKTFRTASLVALVTFEGLSLEGTLFSPSSGDLHAVSPSGDSLLDGCGGPKYERNLLDPHKVKEHGCSVKNVRFRGTSKLEAVKMSVGVRSDGSNCRYL